ncbi:cytochrome b/b6 domain-containing protein [Alteromonas sp. ASW11-19]|uniref:Cytochrome b/b6 domain-containing protein n=1 Tax=Alteromonas salexigens TaxID=2982530 RepID=A0ABT2VL51_9ALTE|nr:cytochrome b/b6 domain-containing protein [Alteromonas salexigens]MCU7553800.1 cytochrome b/b6 domain-containing protein [Alteromonas salexigens]
MDKQLVWDLPTRLFHWLLVAALSAQYVTAEWLDDAMQWHFWIGYFVIGLIVFRIVWGLVGPAHARFSNFITGPVAVWRYLKTLPDASAPAHVGHNPLGGWFVIIMLACVALQAVSGLFMTDDVFLDGPYRHLSSEPTLQLMNTLHHTVIDILLGVIALHIAAIAFYALYKRQSLTPAMVHGKKTTRTGGISSSRLWRALLIAIVVGVTVYAAIFWLPPAPVDDGFYY